MANKDFFLSPDDAQTMGNINYMRKSVRVRHTFPKNLKNPNGFETVKEVSSSEDRAINSFDNSSASQPVSQPSVTSFSSPAASTSSARSSAGTSMDMFRNMARKIGKR